MQDSGGARRQRWISAVESGDADRYAELVAADVVWIPPSGSPILGREAFREWLRPFVDRYDYAMALEPTASAEVGDWAWESGAFVSTMRPKGASAANQHRGRYFVLWRRSPDGVWRIDRYVDVGSQPEAGER